MADFGRPFGPASCQKSLEVSRRANFRRHDIQLRQVDATHPALGTPATETQLPSNIPDIAARRNGISPARLFFSNVIGVTARFAQNRTLTGYPNDDCL